MYSKLLESKQERWTAQQAALKSSITGLAKFFAALQSLPSEGGSPPDFSVWFEHLHQQVRAALHFTASFFKKGIIHLQDRKEWSLRPLDSARGHLGSFSSLGDISDWLDNGDGHIEDALKLATAHCLITSSFPFVQPE